MRLSPTCWLFNGLYGLLLLVTSPWLVYTSWKTGKYRRGWLAKVFGVVPLRVGDSPSVWLHAVSVGEVNLLGGVIAELKRRRPELAFVVTTTTQTGFALATQKFSEHHVSYCPLDFSWAVGRAMTRFRPDLLVLVELELWPNLISAARRRSVPVVVINGRLSEASFGGYRRIRPIVARVLQQLTTVAAQNATYAERFVALGMPRERVIVTGSVKFDNAQTDRDNRQTAALRRLVALQPSESVFLAGSTQDPEEAIAVETFMKLRGRFPNLRLIVVPRHPERFENVHKILSATACRYVRRSEISSPLREGHWEVLLVDTVGELGAWWGTADIALVGGSLGDRGGQNMIEPAAYGAAVCFGPNTRNFRDVVAMLTAHDAARIVADGEELTKFVEACLSGSNDVRDLGRRAQDFVATQRGAVQRSVDILETILSCRSARGPASGENHQPN